MNARWQSIGHCSADTKEEPGRHRPSPQNAADTDPFGSIGSCRSKEIDRIISAVMGRDGLRHLAGEVLR
jgi:hypothetical protein